jgi:hypothetical protein
MSIAKKKAVKDPKMVAALKLLKKLQDKHSGVVETSDLPEEFRILLVTTGFLRQVSKGWYVCSNPKDGPGDSTSWFASFWPFLSGYLRKRFGKRYCLNPEASLLLQTGSTVIPRQVTAVTKESGNSVLNLLFDTSLLVYADERRVPKSRIEVQGLQVLPLPEALCRVQPRFFVSNTREIEIALAQIRDVSELLLLRPDEVLSGILHASVLEVTHDARWVLLQHPHMGAGCVA